MEEKKEKKKMALWKKILIGVLAVIFLFVSCVGIYAISLFSKINRFDPVETIAPEHEDFETDDSDQNASEKDYPVMNPDDVVWDPTPDPGETPNGTADPNATKKPAGTPRPAVTIPKDKEFLILQPFRQQLQPL